MKRKLFKTAGLLLALGLATFRLPACGIYFPNNLLHGGGTAVLMAPVADFTRELQRMFPATNVFQAVTTTNSFAQQSADTELDDLQTALARTGVSATDAEGIIARHELERRRLQAYVEALEASAPLEWDQTNNTFTRHPPVPAPAFPSVRVTPGLPAEFADYFAGAIAWENPAQTNKDAARLAWENVLKLPPAERHFKSTWAAFMLGKFWMNQAPMNQAPEKAAASFRLVRELTGNGYADSCGLAAASFGLEALLDLQQNQFPAGMTLYLEQLQTGDETAADSLQFTAYRALKNGDPALLEQLAASPDSRRVISAYLISSRPGDESNVFIKEWLTAAETDQVRDMDSAEKLALAAYQAGEWDLAERWIRRAPATPVAQWLQAKLLLRDGQVAQAGALLARVARLLPPTSDGTNAPTKLSDDLSVPNDSEDSISAPNQVRGELGVIHLVRRDYVEALDTLLRAGFWMDAAYVAERVLTVDELKKYVDRDWPPAPAVQNIAASDDTDETDPGAAIRHLLARRLARLQRVTEARAYYPLAWQGQFDALQQALRSGHDESLPRSQRAGALLTAAMITRTNGMELLGTELEPDWFIYGGNFQDGVSLASRTNETSKWLQPSADELRRFAQHRVEPDERFHYRFQAAELAFAAAQWLPDNSNETARVLCDAGSWIKYLDATKADPIYKALVRRCGQTAIGRQADQMRWFPLLDRLGNPIPYCPRPTTKLPAPEFASIHMVDRQNGWAQSAQLLFKTNDWIFNDNAILRTTDGGNTWRRILCADQDDDLSLFVGDSNAVWVAAVFDETTNVTVLQTSDGGNDWSHADLPTDYYVQNCYLSFPRLPQPTADENSYPPPVEYPAGWLMLIPDHGMNSSPGHLYRTRDNGMNWEEVNNTYGNPFIWEDTENPHSGFLDPHSYIVCGGSMMFQDASNGWIHGSLASTTPAFVFATQDAGRTWQAKNFPLLAAFPAERIAPMEPPRFFGRNGILATWLCPTDSAAADFYTLIYHSHDGGVTWQPGSPVKYNCAYDFLSAQTGWMWSPEPRNTDSTIPERGILYHTNNGGISWQPLGSALEAHLTHGEHIEQLDFVDENCGWVVTQDRYRLTRLLQTTDGGKTWKQMTPKQN